MADNLSVDIENGQMPPYLSSLGPDGFCVFLMTLAEISGFQIDNFLKNCHSFYMYSGHSPVKKSFLSLFILALPVLVLRTCTSVMSTVFALICRLPGDCWQHLGIPPSS